MCQTRPTAKSNARTHSERKDYDPDFPTVQTLTTTAFLTVNSDPAAEETWQQFSCNDTVRSTSPDFLKSLRAMFASKAPGQYLVKVVATIELSELDFEPTEEPTTPELEEANEWYNADHTAGQPVMSGAQVEAQETTAWSEELKPVGTASDFEL